MPLSQPKARKILHTTVGAVHGPVKPGWRSEDSIERWRKAKRALQGIWMAETKKDALAAFDAFAEAWGVKYDKAVECLIKDRDTLLAFC